MTDAAELSPDRSRARWIAAAGFAIIALSAGAALLPVEKGVSGATIGALLLAAGLIEIGGGALRRDMRTLSMLAGGVTTLAGLLFLLNRDAQIFPTVNIIIAWLFIRGIILAFKSRRVAGGVRTWTTIAAATDFLLGLVLLVGLSLSSVIIILFGPTPDMIASFSWIVALSFVATGLLLLEIAGFEREGTAAA